MCRPSPRPNPAVRSMRWPVPVEPGYHGVFKDGGKRKLKEEKQRVDDWHEIFPGLAPKILAYKKRGDSAAMLIEHLAGQTFETDSSEWLG